MAARSKTDTNGITTGVLEAPNGERERVFEAFRRWGYLEADLDPLGFFRPPVRPELPREGEFVREARRVYCGTVGVEFMHIPEPERRRWIQERMEATARRSRSAERAGAIDPGRHALSRCCSSVIWAPNGFRSKA